VTVLEGLAGVRVPRGTFGLPVLGENQPFRGEASWAESLLRLLSRRVAAFGGQLRAAAGDFDSMYSSLTSAISALPPTDDCVMSAR
jgi:hypothetical protein